MRIGPWVPAADPSGVWTDVGDLALTERRKWAPHITIPERSNRFRLVWLGESAGRGFFHDPYLSPATLIGAEMPDADVVDLAVTDSGDRQQLGLLRDALVLQPDAVALCVGNNWTARLIEFGRAWGEEHRGAVGPGFLGDLGRALLDAMAVLARTFIERAMELTGGSIPVLVVVPAFNSVDFALDTFRMAPPGLSRTELERWWKLERAVAFAEATGSADLEELALTWNDLSLGLSAGPPSVLCRAAAADGEWAAAADWGRRACDAEVWRTDLPPRCLGPVRQVLKEVCRPFPPAPGAGPQPIEHMQGVDGLWSLDMEECCTIGPGVPDRTSMLDYCHPGLATMERLAAAVASWCSTIGGTTARSDASVRAAEQRYSPARLRQIDCRAHVLAAVHNAQAGQRVEIVQHHLRTALDLDVGEADRHSGSWLRLLGTGRAALAGAPVSEALAAGEASEAFRLAGLGSTHLARFAAAAAPLGLGSALRGEPGPGADRRWSLLGPGFVTSGRIHPASTWRANCAAFPVFGAETRFSLPSRLPEAVRLEVVLRVTGAKPVDVRILLEHEPLLVASVGAGWVHLATGFSPPADHARRPLELVLELGRPPETAFADVGWVGPRLAQLGLIRAPLPLAWVSMLGLGPVDASEGS